MILTAFPPIETARLLLRCVEDRDAAATAALITPAVSGRLARWPTPFTTEMAATRIATARAATAARTQLAFAIVERSRDTVIGWLVIHRYETERARGSFGYWLGEVHHGQGYMREAAPAALDHGMNYLGLDIIEAGAQPDHAASFAVLRACGMPLVGEGMLPAPARGRDELCLIYERRRPPHEGPPHQGNTAFAVPGTKG
jgi:ribosomal-protein-alanine N-acetyltransferase